MEIKRGQSWSLDIILAFVIFVLITAVFYAVLNNNSNTNTNIQIEANSMANNLDSATGLNSKLNVIDHGTIDNDKLNDLYDTTYDSIKSQFSLRGDFCIYIVDQKGNLITVNSSAGEMNGYGNGNLSINGKPCGSKV